MVNSAFDLGITARGYQNHRARVARDGTTDGSPLTTLACVTSRNVSAVSCTTIPWIPTNAGFLLFFTTHEKRSTPRARVSRYTPHRARRTSYHGTREIRLDDPRRNLFASQAVG